MKKFLIIAVACVFMLGIVAEAALADERVSVSGSMRVRGWMQSNSDFASNPKDDDTDNQDFIDQRFRMGVKIQAAEGVTGNLRFDFAEDYWGSPNWGGSRYGEGSELQVDRAFLKVDKEMWSVSAGQQYIGLGNSIVYDNNGTGIVAKVKLPVTITLGYTKEDEGGSKNDEGDNDDIDHWLVDLGYATDMWALNVFYAAQQDGKDSTEDTPNAFGAVFKGGFGILNVNAELDIFGGDKKTAGGTVDYVGTQFYGNVNAALNDMWTVGLDLIYATGTKEADEEQIFQLTDFGSFYVMDRGPFNTDIAPFEDFDPSGDGAGAMGGGVYADFAPMEGLTLTGNLYYTTTQEDDATNLDSITVFTIGAQYAFAPKTTIAAGYQYLSPDGDGKIAGLTDYSNADEASTFVWRLQIKF